VVAASAIMGRITGMDSGAVYLNANGPHSLEPLAETVNIFGNYSTAKQSVEIIPQFPVSIEGEIIYCPADNLNTDAIYPGKYTYREDLSTEQMARVAMENYDEQFVNLVKPVCLL
jgi:homoaconitate hydratase